MKQHIIKLYNLRNAIKRELKVNSTAEGIKAYKHITNRLKDEVGVE